MRKLTPNEATAKEIESMFSLRGQPPTPATDEEAEMIQRVKEEFSLRGRPIPDEKTLERGIAYYLRQVAYRKEYYEKKRASGRRRLLIWTPQEIADEVRAFVQNRVAAYEKSGELTWTDGPAA
jgi:hypothetical protein